MFPHPDRLVGASTPAPATGWRRRRVGLALAAWLGLQGRLALIIGLYGQLERADAPGTITFERLPRPIGNHPNRCPT